MRKNLLNFLTTDVLFLGIILSFILFSRILPFIIYGEAPLGYDAGFYRYYINKPFDGFPKQPEFGLERNVIVPRLIMDSLRWFNFSTDKVLYNTYIFLNLTLALLLYFTVKKISNNTNAQITLLIYSLSFTQFLAYWFVLWKTFLALNFLLASIYFQNKKNVSLLFLLLIAFTNTSAFFLSYLLWVSFYLITPMKKCLSGQPNRLSFPGAQKHTENNNLLIIFILLSLPVLFGIWNLSLLKQVWFIAANQMPDLVKMKAGEFIQPNEYLGQSYFYLGLAATSFLFLKRGRQFNFFYLMFLVAGFWILFKFHFYQRIIIFLDLAAIVLAALAIAELYTYISPKIKREFLAGISFAIIALSSFVYIRNIIAQEPLVSNKELAEIKQLSGSIPDNNVIIPVNASINSVLYGYMKQKVVLAGLKNDLWTREEWDIFYQNKPSQQAELLQRYPQPVFMIGLNRHRELLDDLFYELKQTNRRCFGDNPDFHKIIVYKFWCNQNKGA